MPSNKSTLRQQKLAARRQLSQTEIAQKSQQICQHLIASPNYQQARHIACYAATPHEVQLTTFIEQAWQDKKQVYLPVIQDQQKMIFAQYTPNTALYKNKLGVLEPQKQTILAEKLDWILCPLVAFDKQGHRIGQGAGYYDRFAETTYATQAEWIGVAFECQRTDTIPTDAWDKTLAQIITEENIYAAAD
jgi:5-formyltetrahydrofolate cyclo-ligase